MTHRRFPALVCLSVTVVAAGSRGASADAEYSITDGAAEVAVSIDPNETLVWMNTFPVDPAGAYIDRIRVAYGRVGGPTPLNSLPVKILLYEDLNGGSPKDAVLRWSFDTVIANGNTNVLNSYRVPSILVHGHVVAAAYYRNTTPIPIFIGALDTTAPSFPERSFGGWAVALDPADLAAIPASQWGTAESYGIPGNYRIEAHGRTVNEAAVSLAVDSLKQTGFVHLTWTGSQPRYDVERASRPDFRDGVVIAPQITATSHDDPVLNDGKSWFYRVR